MKNIIQFPYKLLRVSLKKTYNKFFWKKDKRMINIGGGNFLRPGWKVLDYNMGIYDFYYYSFTDYNFNLASFDRLPFDDSSIKFLYTSHTLEHIQNKYTQHLFNEFYRVLKKGGAIRITCPDYDKVYDAIKNNDEKFFENNNYGSMENTFFWFFATYFMNNFEKKEFWNKFKKLKKEKLADYYISKIPQKNINENPKNHVNWFNAKKIYGLLKKAGFKRIYESSQNNSKYKEFRANSGLFNSGFDNKIPHKSLYIEAIKI